MPEANPLGAWLKNRRTKLDPASFGLAGGRRRTLGLRREEVAQRANISTTWYTWLEQGRGGRASADVLDRIARALTLTDVEREHLYLLGLGRPPEVQYRGGDPITPRLQRLLDVLAYSPAIVRTATWDVVAWNRAAAAVLTDYGKLPPDQRNILRMLFCDPRVRAKQSDWESVARFVVASFRADAARAGATAEVTGLVEEMSAKSPEFATLWRDNDIVAHAEGTKRLHHVEGALDLEFATFAVDGRPELGMLVYNPLNPIDADRICRLIEQRAIAASDSVDNANR